MENYTKRLIIRLLALLFIIFFSKDIIYPILEVITIRLSYLFLLPLKPVLTSYTTFTIGEHVLKIVPSCIAFSAYIFLYILILTTKDISGDKLIKMFTFGTLTILIINIIRIDLFIYTLVHISQKLFETMHLFFWKVLSGVMVVLIWIYLTKKYNIKEIPVYSDIVYLIKKIRG